MCVICARPRLAMGTILVYVVRWPAVGQLTWLRVSPRALSTCTQLHTPAHLFATRCALDSSPPSLSTFSPSSS